MMIIFEPVNTPLLPLKVPNGGSKTGSRTSLKIVFSALAHRGSKTAKSCGRGGGPPCVRVDLEILRFFAYHRIFPGFYPYVSSVIFCRLECEMDSKRVFYPQKPSESIEIHHFSPKIMKKS